MVQTVHTNTTPTRMRPIFIPVIEIDNVIIGTRIEQIAPDQRKQRRRERHVIHHRHHHHHHLDPGQNPRHYPGDHHRRREQHRQRVGRGHLHLPLGHSGGVAHVEADGQRVVVLEVGPDAESGLQLKGDRPFMTLTAGDEQQEG